jgi:hypothetical protein
MSQTTKRHSFRPLLFAVANQGADENRPKRVLPPLSPPPRRRPQQALPPPCVEDEALRVMPLAPPPPSSMLDLTDEVEEDLEDADLPAGPGSSRARQESYVRLRPSPLAGTIDWVDAQDLLDELCEDQLTLSMNVTCLEQVIEDRPRDASARAALRSLETRLADLAALRDSLATVHVLAADPRFHRLFVADAPLADYMRGLYAWAHAVLRALDQLAQGLRALQPDWATLRWRLEEAKNFHFDELEESIRADITALAIIVERGVLPSARGPLSAPPPPVHALFFAVEAVFLAAHAFEQRLDERFG